MLGDRVRGWPGHIIDVLAVFATLFGLVTSLGFGAQQAACGLNYLFGIPATTLTQVILIALIFGAALVPVLRRLDGGVKRVSEFNMILVAMLLFFVIVLGATGSIPGGFFSSAGTDAGDLIPLSNPFGREDQLHARLDHVLPGLADLLVTVRGHVHRTRILRAQRAFWAIFEGLVAIALLIGGGLASLQAASVSTGLPLALVLLVMCYRTHIGLKNEPR